MDNKSDPSKCPSCKHSIGNPVRPGAPLHQLQKIGPKDLMICCRCFELTLGQEDGTLRVLTSIERAFLFINRGPEMQKMLLAAWMAAEADKQEAN